MIHPLFDFRHLSPAERAQLAVDLWDSIALEHKDELRVPPEHRDEVARRHAAHLQSPEEGAPWEEVQARLLARLEQRSKKRSVTKRKRRP
ncbi:MAG: addiction module protein [Gemmatimonadota bacterium]|nr:addiction module protein [Gemmatimonadota bacterium]